jgi:predicted RNase H-like HicB family nuclease/DNA-binding XRE family transcriptional regulator
VFYVAKITKEGKQTLAEFPDLPGCQTFADPGEDLLERAEEALVGWLETTLDLGRVPPERKASVEVGDMLVPVPTRLAAAIELRRARDRAGLTQAQVAKRSGIAQPMIARLESSKSNPTIDTLERYAVATGANLMLFLDFGNGYEEAPLPPPPSSEVRRGFGTAKAAKR